jgi:tRNA pseudouridine55 synthase
MIPAPLATGRPSNRKSGAVRDAVAVDGIVLLDKPLGLSSNAALQCVKRAFRARKAGHTGSLDPLASGMLPICLGEATKLSAVLLDAHKEYRFTIALGVRTTTGDLEGEIAERRAIPQLEPLVVKQALAAFVGRHEQLPPMHSALKHRGKPLYELARRGMEVERGRRSIEIVALELEQLLPAAITLRARCSKGTYVRSLAEDIAAALGTCGHVCELRRIGVDPFMDEPMVQLAELEALSVDDRQRLSEWLMPPDRAVADWPQVQLSAVLEARLLNGQSVSLTTSGARPGAVRVYGPEHGFLGLGELDTEQKLKPRRLLAASSRLVTLPASG